MQPLARNWRERRARCPAGGQISCGQGTVQQGRQPLPLFLHPVFVKTRHEFAAQLAQAGMQARTHCGLKFMHVTSQSARCDMDAQPVGLQHGAPVGGFQQRFQR